MNSLPPSLDATGGGGDHGDMNEARLVQIETKLDHIEREVGHVKWWIVAQIAAGFVTVVGTGIAIQQMTVATFQAANQMSTPAPAAATSAAPPIIINIPDRNERTAPTAPR